MSSIIQPNYGARAYGVPTRASETKQSRTQGRSFLDLAARASRGTTDALEISSASEITNVTGVNFKEMWQTRFPGAYYHTMDAYKIPSGSWQRNDFPHELFFSDKVDESVLDWKPTGAEPKLTDKSVQSRIDTTLGKKSIVVPPALEEKMKNDPALAQRVMAKVERFIMNDEASLPPGRTYSCVVVLDEDGEIAHACGSSGGGNISGPSEKEMRQFEAEQKAKQKRREENARLAEESALKRRLQEQEAAAIALQHKIVSISGHRELSAPKFTTIPTQAILAITQAQVGSSGAIF